MFFQCHGNDFYFPTGGLLCTANNEWNRKISLPLALYEKIYTEKQPSPFHSFFCIDRWKPPRYVKTYWHIANLSTFANPLRIAYLDQYLDDKIFIVLTFINLIICCNVAFTSGGIKMEICTSTFGRLF